MLTSELAPWPITTKCHICGNSQLKFSVTANLCVLVPNSSHLLFRNGFSKYVLLAVCIVPKIECVGASRRMWVQHLQRVVISCRVHGSPLCIGSFLHIESWRDVSSNEVLVTSPLSSYSDSLPSRNCYSVHLWQIFTNCLLSPPTIWPSLTPSSPRSHPISLP